MNCICQLTKKLCEDKGVDYLYEQDYYSLAEAKKFNKSYDVYAVLDGEVLESPKRRQIKGGAWVLDSGGKILDVNTNFDRVFAKRKRYFNEVKGDLKPSGTYKDSLGGGWYSNVAKYNYKGEEYAEIECSCF
ncbi:MAG: hypothetical protein NXH86_04260 [Flavobacteriaceae bacterium]|nr:hypothetical protein [Flavobacteriaceae bacterium]